MIIDQAGAGFHRVLPCIERAVAVADLSIGFWIELIRGQTESSSESAGTIGRSTHAPLYLDRTDRRRKIRKVNKKSSLAFCIIVRNTIDGHIDPCGIGASDTDTGITYPVSGIG